MKVAHALVVGKHKSGLYESARNLVAQERMLGLDARIASMMPHEEMREDRGALIEPESWAEEADVVVSHSGISPAIHRKGTPVIVVLHGNPEYVFRLDMMKRVESFYSAANSIYYNPIYAAFVTFYPQHLPYWRLVLPEDRLNLVTPPCDLNAWVQSDAGYDFHGEKAAINVICADSWRVSKDPFHIIHGFAEWARKHPEARLHMYGTSTMRLPVPWAVVVNGLARKGQIGEMVTWSAHLKDVYNAADFAICPESIAACTMREQMACGCPVVSHCGSLYAQEQADTKDPVAFSQAMERMWARIQREGREHVRMETRKTAEASFDARKSAEQIAVLIEQAVRRPLSPVHVRKRWFEGGLRFQCEQCGKCCGPGALRMYEAEVRGIATYLRLDFEHVVELYGLKKIGDLYETVATEHCIFQRGKKCSIYPIRPVQCRTFPFWPENMLGADEWEGLANYCPGINAGQLYGEDDILNARNEMMQLRDRYMTACKKEAAQ